MAPALLFVVVWMSYGLYEGLWITLESSVAPLAKLLREMMGPRIEGFGIRAVLGPVLGIPLRGALSLSM